MSSSKNPALPPGGIDSDYSWLMTHLPTSDAMKSRTELVSCLAEELTGRIEEGRLPFTLGIFGGWGTGKTTVLAMLAKELESAGNCKLVYFNSWKYAGFMEIVPALIYKILQYGISGTESERDEAARRVLLALGNKYADQVGDWAKTKIGVNPVDLFKDLYEVPKTIEKNAGRVMPTVIRAYYTQVDKAQDELRKSLGTIASGAHERHTVVVLVDELDRCDPDEAFDVIKQMRVLFGMRDLPIVFVVCANPEPIGLAIKHRYGLESDGGDYEARRILEKFVDSYEDLSGSEALGQLIRTMWADDTLPWMIRFDDANVNPKFDLDTVHNATAFDALTTALPMFANIRLVQKSFEYVKKHDEVNAHLLWTNWFLEIAKQIDPRFRNDIRTLTQTIEGVTRASYESLHRITYRVTQKGARNQITFETDKGGTLFAIYRSLFWEHASEELQRLKQLQQSKDPDPEDMSRLKALESLLSAPLRVDGVILMSLLPFRNVASFNALCKQGGGLLPDFSEELKYLIHQFGHELSRRAL